MVRFLARFQNDRVNFCEFKGGDSSVTDKCHFFKPKESSNTDSEVRYVAGLKLDEIGCYGPVTYIEGSRRIFYPCEKFQCYFECPCFLCQFQSAKKCKIKDCKIQFIKEQKKKVKKVKVKVPGFDKPVNSENVKAPQSDLYNTDCQECEFDFNDHKMFHRSIHLGCDYCDHSREIPVKTFIFIHNTYTVPYKRFDKLVCDNCDMKFKNTSDVQRHLKSVHFLEKEYCPECEIFFSREDLFDRHKKEKHGQNLLEEFMCSKCKINFKRKYHLERHIQKGNENKCDVYEKTFCTSKDLFKHKKSEHKDLGCEGKGVP